MKLARTAQSIAQDVYNRPISTAVSQSAVIRDTADIATGGDLTTRQLDTLCDMIERRLKDPHRYGLTYQRLSMT